MKKLSMPTKDDIADIYADEYEVSDSDQPQTNHSFHHK